MRAIPTIILCLLLAVPALAGDVIWAKEKCIRVVDGDTLVMEVDGLQTRIRVLWIDTPEHGEKGADKATKWVRDHCEGKILGLKFKHGHVDRYGRNLAHVYLPDGRWLAAELYRRGLGKIFMAPDGAAKTLIEYSNN